MNKKPSSGAPAVGGSSLMVIFAVLCLTVFAMLTLSSSVSDRRLADASLKNISGYYKADCAAELILSQLRSGQLPDGVERNGSTFSYTCPVSDTQALDVAVCINGQNDIDILTWQLVSTSQSSGDEALDVWDGQFFE